MKKFYNIFLFAAILCVIYIGFETVFDMFTSRELVFGYVALVIFLMLYFSLRLCFVKNENSDK